MPSRRYIEISATEAFDDPQRWEDIQRVISADLVKNVQRVQRHTKIPSSHSHDSIYTGAIGTAFMEYRLASMHLPVQNNALSAESLLTHADRVLAEVLQGRHVGSSIRDAAHASFLETDIGLAALVLMRAPWTSEKTILDHWKTSKRLLQNAIAVVDMEDQKGGFNEDGCEVLYGRAGLLYAFLALRSALKGDQGSTSDIVASIEGLVSDSKINQIITSIIKRGEYGAVVYKETVKYHSSLPPLMWIWHKKRYLGGAHGISGILKVLLMCPVHLASQHMPKILATVEWLLTCQDDSGNWPTQAPDGLSGRVNDLVQWCHGAPGILILLSTVLRLSRKKHNRIPLDKHLEDKIITSLQHGATLVYRHGFLRKGVGICHGVAGSIYALLAVSDAIDSSNASALGHAARLAHIATKYEGYTSEGEMTVPDHPWSLYEGLAGMCCAWAEVLHRLESKRAGKCSGMPGIDDLG